jgi:hypothetical protein
MLLFSAAVSSSQNGATKMIPGFAWSIRLAGRIKDPVTVNDHGRGLSRSVEAIEQVHILKDDLGHTPLLTVLSRNPVAAGFVLILTILHARYNLILSLVSFFNGIGQDLDIAGRTAIVCGAGTGGRTLCRLSRNQYETGWRLLCDAHPAPTNMLSL